MNPAPRICFVSPSGYPVLAADRRIPVVGGAEVQQAFIAPELVRRGYDVSMISMDFGQREGDSVCGVHLYKMHAPDDGLPVVRFVYPRFTSVWSAMRRANADIYYQRAAGALTGYVARFAKSYGRRFVFASAHDFNFDPTLPALRNWRGKALYRYGVRNAHSIVVQSERQAMLCRQVIGRDSILINSCYQYDGRPASHDGHILWAGRLQSVKRADLFLDLAQRLPQFRFRLVGGGEHFDRLQSRALALGNVEMTGFVPYAEVEPQFDGASLLVNTSAGEGFPNTFMQAWSRGIPTISFFESSARIEGVDVGTVVPDLDAMERAVLMFKTERSVWLESGMRAAAYFRANFSVERSVDAYERVFQDVIRSARPC